MIKIKFISDLFWLRDPNLIKKIKHVESIIFAGLGTRWKQKILTTKEKNNMECKTHGGETNISFKRVLWIDVCN